MHRFFVLRDQFDESAPALTGDEARHAGRARRVKIGEKVVVFDGRGAEWFCEVTAVGKQWVRLHLIERRDVPAPRARVILAGSLLPNRAMEFVIEKATELGASAILPVAARRSVSAVRTAEIAGKMKRWRAISIEAAKQCGASWLPVIEPPQSFGDFLQNAHADLKLIAALDERAQHPRKIFEAFAKKHGGKPETIVVAIGPEGDFTAEELDAAIASGFAPISLGAQTLRSETAAVVALSVLNYEMMV